MTYYDLPSTQRVQEHIEASPESMGIIVALTNAALAARAAVLDSTDQLHVQSATWGLSLWEELLAITPAAGASDEARRTAITTKLLGSGTCDAGMIQSIVKQLTGYDCVVVEQTSVYTFSIYFVGDTSEFKDFDLPAILAAVEEVKPAHLKFVITPITWGDLEATGLTWGELALRFPTWGSVELAVTVHEREEATG